MRYRFITLIIIATIALTGLMQAGSFSKKLTLETYMFLKQYEQIQNTHANKKAALKNYSFQEDKGTDIVKLYIKINDKYSQSEIEKLGCEVLVKTKSVVLVSVPVFNVEKLTELDGIDLLEIGTKPKLLLDKALPSSNVDKVHQGIDLKQSYYGKDVIVGVIDIGFDFTHPMFLDSLGHSRVKRAWLLADPTGTPPANSKLGTLYTDSNYILNKLKFSSQLSFHGSHVLGIAAGSRVDGQKYKYSGVASGADIAVVDCGIDEENIELIEAIRYLFSYADSVSKPIVVNMSLGWNRPGNVSYVRDLQMSEYLSTQQQGKIAVAAAGNEGNTNMHFQHKFNNDGDIYASIGFTKPMLGMGDITAKFDCWGEPKDTFSLDLEIMPPSSAAAYYIKKISTNDAMNLDTTITINFTDTSKGTNSVRQYKLLVYACSSDTVNYITSNPYISCNITDITPGGGSQMGNNDAGKVLFSVSSKSANIHCWNLESEAIECQEGYSNTFTPDSYYTVASPAILDEVVAIGAYVSRDTIVPYSSIMPRYSEQTGKVNDIANFSSKGPLLNGKIKPDITAPGSSVYSAFNSFESMFSQIEILLQMMTVDFTKDQKHRFFTSSGTSMSSPLVAGIVALMLEINPKLTQSEIKDIMRITAINDEFTGNAKENKSPIWGWGKIDAHTIMKNLELKSIDEKQNFEFTVFPNPTVSNEITVSVENETGTPFIVNIYDQTGKLVYISSLQTTKTFDISKLQSGAYFLKIDNGRRNSVQKITVAK